MQNEEQGQEGGGQEVRPQQENEGAGRAALLDRVARFYNKALASAQKTKGWLTRHGLNDGDLADHWLLGAANGRLLKTLPTEADEPGKRLKELGIVTPTGGELFSGLRHRAAAR